MNCSQGLEVLRQFTRGASVRLKSTANLWIFFLEQTHLIAETWTFCKNIWGRFGVAWISALRLQGEDIHSLRMMESPSHSPLGRGWRRLTPRSWAYSISLPPSLPKPLCSVPVPADAPTLTLLQAGNTKMILVLEKVSLILLCLPLVSFQPVTEESELEKSHFSHLFPQDSFPRHFERPKILSTAVWNILEDGI